MGQHHPFGKARGTAGINDGRDVFIITLVFRLDLAFVQIVKLIAVSI